MARRRTRIRSRFRRHHKQGLVSKAINAGALLIGASPAISIAQSTLMRGDFQGFAREMSDTYSAGLSTTGTFDFGKAANAYGPIVAAILFKKGISFLRKHTRF